LFWSFNISVVWFSDFEQDKYGGGDEWQDVEVVSK
jgi:hypothetical protein